MKKSSRSLFLIATLMAATFSMAASAAKDPTQNPNAVKHHIDRSASDIQIWGWTPDLKYPLYHLAPVRDQNGQPKAYTLYEDKDLRNKSPSNSGVYTLEQLRCEIGFADEAVLKKVGTYLCSEGVCRHNFADGIIGVDPRANVKKVRC